jgi:hypothetical protein
MYRRICPECGESFCTKRPKQVRCSRDCVAASRGYGVGGYTRISGVSANSVTPVPVSVLHKMRRFQREQMLSQTRIGIRLDSPKPEPLPDFWNEHRPLLRRRNAVSYVITCLCSRKVNSGMTYRCPCGIEHRGAGK